MRSRDPLSVRRTPALRVALVAASLLALTACNTTPPPEETITAGEPPAAPADTMWGKFLRGTGMQAEEMDTSQLLKVAYCPKVDVREGTQVYQVGESGQTDNPGAVRFQASISRFARECRQDGDSIRIRVGVAGRVLTGPKGGSSTLSLPVRVVVVGPDDKVLYTRLSRVPASVSTDQPSVGWSFVDEDVVIPSAPGALIYVGFDPKGDAPARKSRARS